MRHRPLSLLLAPCLALLPAAPGEAAGLEVVGGGFEREGVAYRAVGVNYFDAFLRTLREPGDFQRTRSSLTGPANTSYEAGFDGLAAAGVPFIRFNAGGFRVADYRLYQKDKAAYLAQMRAVVDAADARGIGVVPSVFWQTDSFAALAGENRAAWADAGSATRRLADAYARDVVGALRGANNVLMWEFGNEFNLQQDLPVNDDRPATISSAGVRDAVAAFAGVVAELDPARTTTTGHSVERTAAAALRQSGSFRPLDTREDFREVTITDHAGVGVISAHLYQHSALGLDPKDSTADPAVRFGEPGLAYVEVVAELMAASAASGKPLFLGEFGVGEGSALGAPDAPATEAEQLRYLLDAIVEEQVPLSALWVYDRLFTGRNELDYTITTRNDRADRLALIAEANRRLAVPEPGTLGLAGAAALPLLRRRR
ncbi:glycoside hydrolase 5 family protein [Phycisphaera mikurensis]|uniref:Uncharacterized protein n=1 Tax=Phycisphaera mikurensis (strain NBRC 102666 / KCTC 22515 / FYK2301M01) TaxID=1142394 RepID=I0IHM8_PHYMF|nr:cellulase family glycosylhydrolase [Phycisphaera mikurensis]MBB6441011.1 hypothetical protein [Phycisphaera mikurensis]BAM04766.1 hypothetical protein PSMK_26070 [Phycisphaera mikurensis NBRC 102666]